MGLWKLSEYGIAAVTVLGVIPSLIIGAILFAVGFTLIVLWGLVSAVIWTIGGVGLVWALSWFGVFSSDNIGRHPKLLLLLGIIPLFFFIGYASDHLRSLAVIAPSRFISANPYLAVQSMSLQGDAVTFIMSNLTFAVILGAAAFAVGSFAYWRFKHK